MKDPQQIVNALVWVVIAGLGFAILCTIIYYTVYRKRLPCIEDAHRKFKPKDVDGLQLVCTPMDHENEFMKIYKKGREQCPTLRECVKICEENPEICEMLAYLQKEKENEKMNTEMPKLQFGDVVKWDDDHYGMVGNTRVYDLVNVNGLMGPNGVSKDTIANIQNDNHVVRVYRKAGYNGFDQTDLYSIQNGLAEYYVIWEKQQVREMTVDEISKELGYTVKVIGSGV